MTDGKKLIDSNILAYAYDRTSNKHSTGVRVLKEAMVRQECVLSIQNLVEFSRLITEKLPKKISFEQARSIVLELSEGCEVIYYDAHAVADALGLCESHKIHFFDALIAATMEKEKIYSILTENDKDFKKIPWLNVANPFRQDVIEKNKKF